MNFDFLESKPKRGESDTAWAKRIFDEQRNLLIGADPEEINDDDRIVVPQTFEFFGQEDAMAQVAPFLARQQSFPNTLILGMPGIGKTYLAKWIASRRLDQFEELLCPVNPDDLPPDGIVLLDECHRQRHPEWLFPSLESPDFTIIGATTRPEQLDPAFKSRFILTLHLKRYSHEAMMKMAQSGLAGLSDESADVYAAASAGNPRQLELLLEIARAVGQDDYEAVLSAARITGDGLTDMHLRVLNGLAKAGRPTGLATLASMLYTDEQTVREHEQYLVWLGLVEMRSNGRILSRNGRRYLKEMEQ